MKIRKVDRPIPRVKPVQKSGDKADMKDKGKNGDRNTELDYLLCIHEKNKDTTA